MVVDPDEHVHRLTSAFLKDADYTVESSHDGYDALDRIRKSPPHIVLTDILLPKLDGLALCRLLKSDAATQDIVTVIIFSVLEASRLATESGADGFLLKPLERNRLTRALEEAIKRGRSIA